MYILYFPVYHSICHRYWATNLILPFEYYWNTNEILKTMMFSIFFVSLPSSICFFFPCARRKKKNLLLYRGCDGYRVIVLRHAC
jgi:hypothetical protein